MKKLFLFTVFVLICALTLCSCAKKTDNLDEFEQLLLSTSDGESENEAFAKLLYVIIPKDCSPDVTARATALAEAIEQKTGIETILKYDNVEVDKGQGIIEILVGKTSRLYSSELTRALRIDDYICKYERGSVVIGALSDEATLAAIDRFEADVLPGASRSYFMSESTKIEYFGEYEFDSVRLNGYDIREYNICYNSEKEYTYEGLKTQAEKNIENDLVKKAQEAVKNITVPNSSVKPSELTNEKINNRGTENLKFRSSLLIR